MVVPALGSSVSAVPRAGSALTGMAACMANDVRRPVQLNSAIGPVSGRRSTRGADAGCGSLALIPPPRSGPPNLKPHSARPAAGPGACCAASRCGGSAYLLDKTLTICARHDESAPISTQGNVHTVPDLVKNQLPESYS